jgi:hypothetical protein
MRAIAAVRDSLFALGFRAAVFFAPFFIHGLRAAHESKLKRGTQAMTLRVVEAARVV